ncbi:MAG: hypothetical protein HY819_21500 [Acidobacteria bacterium]|nr:hypothetical protein [Acidobacteriota bacterium]
MKNRLFYFLCNLLIVCIYILALSINPIYAQSGRRVQPPPPPPPEPSSVPSQPSRPADEPAPAPEKTVEVVARLLVTQDDNKFDNLGNLANVVVSTCTERLRQATALSIAKEKPLDRKQASDKAKAEEQHHVVWLQVQVDRFNNSRSASLQDFQVEYIVFSPKDGKIKTQGKVYLRPYQPSVGVGGIAVPVPIPVPNSPIGVPGQPNPLQHSLEQAGVETADRIMQAFKVSPPPISNRRP